MASFTTTTTTLHGMNSSLLRSQFLGQDHHNLNHHHFPLKHPQNKPSFDLLQPHAKFNLVEIMGGRGICNGEKGIQLELERKIVQQKPPHEEEEEEEDSEKEEEENSSGVEVSEDAFEKEMMGLTGGFPGGEKGLQKFIEENPPCSKSKQGTFVNQISERKEAKAIG